MQRGASFNLEAVKAEIEERIGAMKGKMEQRRLFLLPVHGEKVDAPKARPDEGSRPISTKGKTGRSIASGAVRQARGRAPITAGLKALRPNEGLRPVGQKSRIGQVRNQAVVQLSPVVRQPLTLSQRACFSI